MLTRLMGKQLLLHIKDSFETVDRFPDRERPTSPVVRWVVTGVVEDGEPMPKGRVMHSRAFRFFALIREGEVSCSRRKPGNSQRQELWKGQRALIL